MNRVGIAPSARNNRPVSQSQPGPPQRVGDAERDRAAELLREHHAQGRLDASEFDERISAALSAKWQSDLDRLFFDLPGPGPGTAGSVVPTPQQHPAQQHQQNVPGLLPDRVRGALDVLSVAIWPIAIAGTVLLHRGGFLIFIAIALTVIWHRRRGQDNAARARLERDARQQQESERRRLEQERRRFDNGDGPWSA